MDHWHTCGGRHHECPWCTPVRRFLEKASPSEAAEEGSRAESGGKQGVTKKRQTLLPNSTCQLFSAHSASTVLMFSVVFVTAISMPSNVLFVSAAFMFEIASTAAFTDDVKQAKYKHLCAHCPQQHAYFAGHVGRLSKRGFLRKRWRRQVTSSTGKHSLVMTSLGVGVR